MIVIGFVIFLILAPLIVLYVRGITYDFSSGQFVQTGILAVHTNPASAGISLNGKLASKTSADIKFLPPKEYDITVNQPGYRPWEKRLRVTEGKVTWASPPSGYIYLFLASPASMTLASDAADFYASPEYNLIAILTKNSLVLTSAANPAQSQVYPLPAPAASLTASPDGRQFILNGSGTATPAILYFNIADKKFINLRPLFPTTTPSWLYDGNGKLYALSGKQLFAIDPAAGQKRLLQTELLAATFQDENLYGLQQQGTTTALSIWTNPAGAGQAIITGLPLFHSASLFVSFEKQIFLLADSALYKADLGLTPLADNISAWDFNQQESSLIFFHDGELDYFNPFDNTIDLITRRGGPITDPLLRLSLNNAFLNEGNRIKALELDTRDHQNEYDLYNGTDIIKFSLNDSGTELLVLDGSTLKLLTIR